MIKKRKNIKQILTYAVFVFTFLLFNTTKLKSQVDNWQLKALVHVGKIVPHRTYFKPQITEPTLQYEISWVKQTNGKALWSEAYKYPEYGVSAVFVDLGDRAIFGYGLGLLPYFNFKKRFKPFDFNIKVGVGLTYVSKVYNPISNETNNAIGGHFNNFTRFEFGFNRKIFNQISADANLSLTHFSNGNTEQPNLGINIIGASLGVSYLFNEQPNFEKRNLKNYDKRFKLSLHAGLGYGSIVIYGGPNYPVWVTGLYVNRNISIKGRVMLGINYEYHYSVKRFIYLMERYQTKQQWRASKILVMGGYELLMNHFSIPLQIGTYLYNPILQKGDIVVKLGAKYHFKDTYQINRFNPYIGIFLKAHGASADFTEMAFGIEF